MKNLIKNIHAELLKWNKNNYLLDERQEGDDPCLIEFAATPYAELGWNTAGKPEDGIYLHISPRDFKGETYEDLEDQLFNLQFELFYIMREIISCDFAERTDSDALSFEYKFIARTPANGCELEIKITDHLS